MTKRNIIIIVVIAVLVLGAVLLVLLKKGSSLLPVSVVAPGGETPAGVASSTSSTRTPVADNVTVPDKGSSVPVPSNVGRPDMQGPGSVSGGTEFRGFSITAENDAFTPSTIIVTQGDTVHLKFKAVGKDYDLTQPDYGFSFAAAKGTEKSFQFDATAPGTFQLFCKVCGGPAKGPIGSLVVAPKK